MSHRGINAVVVCVAIILFIIGTFVFNDKQEQFVSSGEMLYGATEFGEQIEPIIADTATIYSDYVTFKITDEQFQKKAKGLSDRITPIVDSYSDFRNAYAVTGADKVYSTAMDGMGNAITLTKILIDEPMKKEIDKRQDYLSYYVKMTNLINQNLDVFKVCAKQVGEENSK